MNIKELRLAKGLTQMQLAIAVGVSIPSIQFWENGASTPNDENMAKLKEVLGVK